MSYISLFLDAIFRVGFLTRLPLDIVIVVDVVCLSARKRERKPERLNATHDARLDLSPANQPH